MPFKEKFDSDPMYTNVDALGITDVPIVLGRSMSWLLVLGQDQGHSDTVFHKAASTPMRREPDRQLTFTPSNVVNLRYFTIKSINDCNNDAAILDGN